MTRNVDTQYLELCERIAALEETTHHLQINPLAAIEERVEHLQARLDDEIRRRRVFEALLLVLCQSNLLPDNLKHIFAAAQNLSTESKTPDPS